MAGIDPFGRHHRLRANRANDISQLLTQIPFAPFVGKDRDLLLLRIHDQLGIMRLRREADDASTKGNAGEHLVACSNAIALSPSTTKTSKFSASKTKTASAIVRTTRVSTSSIISKMLRARSWKTGSAFSISSRVSTIACGKLRAGSLPA